MLTLAQHPLFMDHADVCKSLCALVKPRRFGKDATVILHGTEANALWLVLSGWVTLARQTPDGKEAIVGLCTEGDVFGEAALFAHASYPYNAQAVSDDAELASIPATALREAIQENPGFSTHVMAILGERIATAQIKIEQMSTLSATQRLGCFLLRLCHTQANGTRVLHMPVEKHTIASFLGMKPETLSRSIQQLGDIGIRAQGAHLTIDNVSRLRDFVCGSCGESGMCETEESLMDAKSAQGQK